MNPTIWTSKKTNQRYLVFGISHWDPDRYSELFIFFRRSEKYLWKRSVLDNVTNYMHAVLLKKEFLFRHYSKILPVDSVGRVITEQQVCKEPFQS